MSYLSHLSVLIFQMALLAQATDAMGGHAGRIGVSAIFFAAIGGYAYAIGTVTFGLSPWIAVIFGLITVMLSALFLASLFLRLTINNYLLATLAAQMGFLELANNTDYLGGPLGITNVPIPMAISGGSNDPALAALMLLIPAAFLSNLLWIRVTGPRARFGRMIHWIRDDIDLAKAWGLPVFTLLGRVFVLHAVVSACAGIGLVISQAYVSPQSFGLNLSLSVLTVVFISGAGGRPPIMFVGVILVLLIGEALRSFGTIPELVGDAQRIVLNGALIAILLLHKHGLAGPILGHGPSSSKYS